MLISAGLKAFHGDRAEDRIRPPYGGQFAHTDLKSVVER